MENGLTHFDASGQAIMVDVSEKKITARTAVACGTITVNAAVFAAIAAGTAAKGDVLGTARIAAIMATKHTAEVIPLCHQLPLTKCAVDFELKAPDCVKVEVLVKTTAKTGVEMEALYGASVALLTIYDMCKAIDKAMLIGPIYLQTKTGGKSGTFQRKATKEPEHA